MAETKPGHLSPEDAAAYRALLEEAFAKADTYLGTEVEAFLGPLLEMEQFIKARKEHSRPAHEYAFARAAGYPEPKKARINRILGFAAESFNRRVQEQGGDPDGMLSLLQKAGAMVVREGKDFIPTEPRRLNAPRTGLHQYETVMQPRLAWLAQGLRSIGLYPEDLVIHMREKDPRKMKAAPHMLIEIPRLKKQVMLNQQKGEVTFVAQQRFEFDMWERLNKYQLKKVPGVTPVVLRDRDRWLNRILGLLQEGDTKPGPKIDLAKDAVRPARKGMPYSVDLIVESLRAAHAARKEYPSISSGVIVQGPLANGVRTWASVNNAMASIWRDRNPVQSCNGLTRENCSYTNLRNLKDRLGLNDHYTVEDIIASIRAAHVATQDYPLIKSGVIVHGPLVNGVRTWASVNDAMVSIWRDRSPAQFYNGLTRENCSYTSLGDLKDRLGLNDHYTVEDIIVSIRATQEATQDYPSMSSGVIVHGPLANGVRTWASVQAAIVSIWKARNLHQSCNGLTRENCLYTGLGDLKDRLGLNDHYTVEDIIASIRATQEATQDYPAIRSGMIVHGPLANGVRTWASVHSAMVSIWRDRNPAQFCNGLTRENCSYTGLGDLKDRLGLNDDYTVEEIIASIRATQETTQDYPSQNSGVIVQGPLANGVRTWGAVNAAMTQIWKDRNPLQSCNGLTRENCSYTGLGDLKDRLGLNDDYTVEDIIASIRATQEATQDYPSMSSGVVLHGSLANGVRTWVSVNCTMVSIWRDRNPAQFCNGLTRENCRYKSLADIKNALGLSAPPTRADAHSRTPRLLP